MSNSYEVVLEPATLRDAAVLSNLLELYSHDLSDVSSVHIVAPGSAGAQPSFSGIDWPLVGSSACRRETRRVFGSG
jgi:hypothetical protein